LDDTTAIMDVEVEEKCMRNGAEMVDVLE